MTARRSDAQRSENTGAGHSGVLSIIPYHKVIQWPDYME